MALQSKLIILALLIMTIVSCSTPERTTHNILVVYDVTGSVQSSLPSAEQIMANLNSMVDVEQSPSDGYKVYITRIDDVSGGRMTKVSIPVDGTNAATGNPKKRQREVAAFVEDTKKQLEEVLAGSDMDKGSSKIYNKLCRSVNTLDKTSGEHYVLVYSDMMENSELASFYTPSVLDAAATGATDFAMSTLASSCTLPDLTGYTIALYPYRTAENDRQITKAEQFWTTLLQSKGGQVSVDQ